MLAIIASPCSQEQELVVNIVQLILVVGKTGICFIDNFHVIIFARRSEVFSTLFPSEFVYFFP